MKAIRLRPTSDGRIPWRATVRGAISTACATTLMLLIASCSTQTPAGSSDSPHAEGPTRNTSMLAYSQCVRSHGVPSYPDPDSNGSIPKETPSQLGVTDARLQSAQTSCSRLLPNGGNGPSQSQLQQEKAQGLRFAKCMRNHGVALPDPDSSGRIPDPATVGIDQGSPQFQAANQACRKDRPAYMPSNAAYNAWAQSHSG